MPIRSIIPAYQYAHPITMEITQQANALPAALKPHCNTLTHQLIFVSALAHTIQITMEK